MSLQTFEIGNVIAMLIAATGFYIFPFEMGSAVAILAIGFEIWSIPKYIDVSGIHNAPKGYLCIAAIFLIAGFLLGKHLLLSFVYISVHFVVGFAFIFFFIDDKNTIEEEFNKRIKKTVLSYERNLTELRTQIKIRLTPEEYEAKVSAFREMIQQAYDRQIRLQSEAYERKIREISAERIDSSHDKMKVIQQEYQKKKDALLENQKNVISEYVSKLDELQKELAHTKTNADCQRKILEEKNRELNRELKVIRADQNELIKKSEKHSHNEILRNKEIRDKLHEIIQTATMEIDIIAPWMNEKVVDQFFIDGLNRAVSRGVNIKIRYGIGNISASGLSFNNKAKARAKADKTINTARLLEREIVNKNRLHLCRGDEHSKLIICDNSYYILTSFNPLSFKGEYKEWDTDQRGEIGEISYDTDNLQVYRDKFFNFTGIEIK